MLNQRLSVACRAAFIRITSYLVLSTGFLLSSFSALIFILWPLERTSDIVLTLLSGGATGLVLMASFAIIVYQGPGLKKGVLKNPVVYCLLALVLFLNGMFAHRDMLIREDPKYEEKIIAEVNRHYLLPADENSASLYREIFNIPIDKIPNSILRYSNSNKRDPEGEAWFNRHEKFFSLVLEADRKCSDPFFAIEARRYLSEARGSRMAIYRLYHGAKYLITHGRTDEAAPILHCAFNLVTALRKHRLHFVVESHKFRNEILYSIHDILKNPNIELAEKDLQEIQFLLDKWSSPRYWSIQDLRQSLKLTGIYSLKSLDFRGFLHGLKQEKRKIPAFFMYHFFTRSSVENLLKENWDRLFRNESMLEVLNYQGKNERIVLLSGLTCSPSKIADDLFHRPLEQLKETIEVIFDCKARLQVLRAYVAARRFYIAEKRTSKDWHDLVPGYLSHIPLDPYTNKPICVCWKCSIFYSIGKDRMDQHGEGFFVARHDHENPQDIMMEYDACFDR